MNDLELRDIYVYPIKSLGGISLQEAEVEERGLRYDRRWMLTDQTGKFMSQRTYNQMALLQVNLEAAGLVINHKKSLLKPLTIPLEATTQKEITVSVWDDVCTASVVSSIANEWFSDALHMPVQLVYMAGTTNRFVDTSFANNGEIVSFADAFPFLMIGQSSLDDLNLRLKKPLPMNRFRPNFVFTGGVPYIEDTIHTFCIGDITFNAVKPCARCVLTTIDQEEATKSTEPLKTLSTYRTVQNKILFGQNLIQSGAGVVKVGDKLAVQRWTK